MILSVMDVPFVRMSIRIRGTGAYKLPIPSVHLEISNTARKPHSLS